MIKSIDKLLKYLPLVSVLIVAISYLKQSVYYYQFNIDIINYISLSEFFSLFLKDSLFIISMILVTLLSIFYLRNLSKVRKILTKVNLYLKILISLIIWGLVIFLSIFLFNDIKNDIKGIDFNLSILIVIVPAFLYLITFFSLLIMLKKNISRTYKIGTGIVFIVLITITIALFQAQQVKENLYQNRYEINISEKTIETNENLVRIGQTEKYFFLFNRKNQSSKVIAVKDIIDVTILPNIK